MTKFNRLLGLAAFAATLSIASLSSVSNADAFPFFPKWGNVSGMDLGSGR